jgi:tetratricopeptide (TPR) repeat protein
MSLEESVIDLAGECVFNKFTAENKVGSVAGGVGALCAVGALGLAGPIAVPLAIAGGVLAGAQGESSVKITAKSIGSIVGSVASGVSSVVGNTTKGITEGFLGFIDIFKSDVDFFKRGVEKLENKQYAEAVEDFSRVIEINPSYTAAYYLRACIYSDTGKYQAAIEDLSKVIKIDPQFEEAYFLRGCNRSES